MSAIVYRLRPDSQVLWVATDTVVQPDDRTDVRAHGAKALYVPHLGTLVTCMGHHELFHRWYLQILDLLPAGGDVDALDAWAPVALRRLWETEGFAAACAATGKASAITHFGYSAAGKEMRVYTYRSADGFASERPTQRFSYRMPGIYAEVDAVLEQLQAAGLHRRDEEGYVRQLFIRTIAAAKRHQETLPEAERILMGGEIHLATLHPTGANFERLFRFTDAPAPAEGDNPLIPAGLTEADLQVAAYLDAAREMGAAPADEAEPEAVAPAPVVAAGNR